MNTKSKDWTLQLAIWENDNPVEDSTFFMPEEIVQNLLQVSNDRGLDVETLLQDMVSVYIRSTGDSAQVNTNVNAVVPA